MHLKRLLPMLVLGAAGCATNFGAPQVPPSALWDGESGWRLDPHSVRVNEGMKRAGDVILEHDAQLRRTGLIMETIRLRNAYGTEMIIPEGSKAFATDYTLTTGPRRIPDKINPIEWCAFLPRGIDGKKPGPQSVCMFWQSEQVASYTESEVGEFSFLPGLPASGMPGPVPRIEEAPVDFGIHFTRQLRVGAMTEETITLEITFNDGTTSSHPKRETYKWRPDGTLVYRLHEDTIVLTRSADRKTVEVRLLVPEPREIAPNVTEYTVALELLVGTDGFVKEARVLRSSGRPDVDALAIKAAQNDLKLEPFMENGRRVEKRGRFPVKVRMEK